MKRSILVLVILSLAGCARSVSEISYYLLEAPASMEQPEEAGASPALALWVRDPVSPTALATEALAYRPAPTRIAYYGYHRWIAPPAHLVGERLRGELARSNRFLSVTGPADAGKGCLLLEGLLTGFHEEDAPEGWYAVVSLELELRRIGEDRALWRRAYQARRPGHGSTPGDVVRELDRAMAELAPRILRDLEEAVAGLPESG